MKFGEIDILAEASDDTLILIEVKAKTSLEFGQPFEMVNYRKRKKLIKLAQALMQLYPKRNIRIDVASIDLSGGEASTKIEYLENAIEAN